MNSSRRKFLKLIAFGGVAAVAGRFLGGKALAFADPKPGKKNRQSSEQDQIPEDIKTVRRGKNVVFVDRSTGDEIFILERE